MACWRVQRVALKPVRATRLHLGNTLCPDRQVLGNPWTTGLGTGACTQLAVAWSGDAAPIGGPPLVLRKWAAMPPLGGEGSRCKVLLVASKGAVETRVAALCACVNDALLSSWR